MIVLFSIITAFYVIIISILYVSYEKVTAFEFKAEKPISNFSVIIPFRNEAKNLEVILNSLASVNYPKSLFEIILVNDASEDNSLEVIQSFLNKNQEETFNISIIQNKRYSNSPKKDAIETALAHAKYEWIITTDADCVVPKLWLQTFDAFIRNKDTKLIVAPVTYHISDTILGDFQLHDMLSLQTATVGAFGIEHPFLCNGANLCYSKSVFTELNGFEGNNSIASGDDLFLMEKIVKNYPNNVHFLKLITAVVYTNPEPTLKSLFNQRVRWASKTSAYSNVFSKVLAVIVLLMNASLVLGFVFALLGLMSWSFLIILFVIKLSIDYFFVLKSSRFFEQNSSLKNYPFSSLIYPFFVVAVCCYSVFFKYKWKGRNFKK